MGTRIIIGVSVVAVLLGAGVLTVRAGEVAGARQWAIVNFPDVVQVKDQLIMGQVLIVHDNDKMARGEACTTFYRFEPGKGPKEELVSFHCRPETAPKVGQTTFTLAETSIGCRRLVSYQIAGDDETHGVPAK
jgi:hypothetical protein